MISSPANARAKWVRRLQEKRRDREAEGVFVVEGTRLAQEAVQAQASARLVLHTSHVGPRERSVINGLARLGADVEEASESVLSACASTDTPPPLLAVVARPDLPLPAPLRLVVVADRLADPGNSGSLLRTARAAGSDGVFLSSGTVDAFNPKVVRGAMGAHFHLPLRRGEPAELISLLEALSIRIAAAGEGERYDRVDWRQPAAVVIGGEAEGAGGEWRRASAGAVHIPMAAANESLNAAVACGILLFEIRRQREDA